MAKARVLAVDDQRYFRELIDGVLSDEGYEVVTVESGDEALHVLERVDFDVVITDLAMPGMDGVELVRRIKERKPDQEIVIVSGISDVNSAVEAMKQGARDYILKPIDDGLLTSALDDILQRRRIAEEHTRLLSENQEHVGMLALYERAAALFSTLAVQPLGERFIEDLCLETGAQGGVLWTASDRAEGRLQLVAAMGIIRIDEEPRELVVSRLGPELEPLLRGSRPLITSRRADNGAGSALFVPIRKAANLIGLARLSDKLEGEDFCDRDALRAEVFTRFGEIALDNALQFREIEGRSLRDVRTGAYTQAYFEDVLRNEIQKSNRFGRPLSIARLDLGDQEALRGEVGDAAYTIWRESIAQQMSHLLRSTDLLCEGPDGHFSVLLTETDATATGVLLRRIRNALETVRSPGSSDDPGAPQVVVATVTYPADGTQLESLRRTLDARIVEQRSGGAALGALAGGTLAETIQDLLSRAEVVPTQLPRQIVDFLIDEAVRRPSEKGLLFLAAGSDGEAQAALIRKLDEVREVATGTRLVVAAGEAGRQPDSGPVTWIPNTGLGTDRLCVLYWGERPAYALLAGEPNPQGETTVFHTADRALVEQLAFQVQRDLEGVPSFDGAGAVS